MKDKYYGHEMTCMSSYACFEILLILFTWNGRLFYPVATLTVFRSVMLSVWRRPVNAQHCFGRFWAGLAISEHTFASDWQLSFFESAKGVDGRRNYFMIVTSVSTNLCSAARISCSRRGGSPPVLWFKNLLRVVFLYCGGKPTPNYSWD